MPPGFLSRSLDSSSDIPDPGTPVALAVFLPEGRRCEIKDGIGGTRIEFEGEGYKFWQITTTDPSLGGVQWSTSINISVLKDTPTTFWIRGFTESQENSQNDTRPKLKILGNVEAA